VDFETQATDGLYHGGWTENQIFADGTTRTLHPQFENGYPVGGSIGKDINGVPYHSYYADEGTGGIIIYESDGLHQYYERSYYG
jgi:hypothetical protein